MTAEIAILNRSAVALAADSIVTLAGGMQPKTYDSAEKIFELSCKQPLALMIYNNAQFMGAPFDVIIRMFRNSLTTSDFQELVQVWPKFETFLLQFRRTGDVELDHFRSLVLAEVNKLKAKLQNTMIERLGRAPRKTDEALQVVAVARCLERQREAEASPLPDDFLADVTLKDFDAVYGAELDTVVTTTLSHVDLTPELAEALRAMMLAVIRSDHRSDAYTGLVFAGFGTREIFPTLNSVEIDGVYFNRFRILSSQIVDIDRAGVKAAVVPFAQKDMAERFIDGIDQELEVLVQDMVANLTNSIIDQNKAAFPSKAALDRAKAAARKQFVDGLERLKKKNAQELRSVVDFLSKKELAEVAYSLVELTSRKRRYSSAKETVGGPIDVAILTLNEGFIWVRRKHYFNLELNPRYEKRL